MKEGWKVVKIKDICEASNGLWKGKKPPYKKIAVIRNTNFSKDCKLKLDNVEYIDVEERQYISRKLEYGDIIIEKSGGSDKQPVGRPILFNVIEGDFSYSNFTSRLRINDSGSVDSHYLHKVLYHLYLEGATFNLQSNTTGIHNLDLKGYLELEIPLPPLPEQHRIVKKLDAAFEKIDAMKAKAEKNIENAKALFQQTLAEELEPKEGWVEKKLGEVCEIRPNKSFAFNKLNDCDSVSFLPMEDLGVFDRFICVKKIKKIHEVKKSSYTYFENGDILLAKVTPCFENGKLGITHNLVNGIGFGSSEYIVFRPYECILNSYVYYQLANPKFRDMGKKLMLGACGLKRLSKEYVINYNVSFPQDKEIQQQIVTKLDILSAKCKKLEEAERKTIAECDALKQAILRQAFNGEL